MRRAYRLNADGTASTRGDAVVFGKIRYFTGKPCRRAHVAERYASTGNCVQCLSEQNKNESAAKRDAKEKLAWGRLPKEEAIEAGVPYYSLREPLDCGHVAWRFVVDDRCTSCADQEEIKQRLDLIGDLLS